MEFKKAFFVTIGFGFNSLSSIVFTSVCIFVAFIFSFLSLFLCLLLYLLILFKTVCKKLYLDQHIFFSSDSVVTIIV